MLWKTRVSLRHNRVSTHSPSLAIYSPLKIIMSQHYCLIQNAQHKPLSVVSGYDRQLNQYVLTVYQDASHSPDTISYTSLREPHLEWETIEVVNRALSKLQISVPDSLMAALENDQVTQAGNRVVEHSLTTAPNILYENPSTSE